ncbi:MAG: hypothetical protein ACXWNB_11815 [Candidatus Binataceae bacterium]
MEATRVCWKLVWQVLADGSFELEAAWSCHRIASPSSTAISS